MEFVANKRTLEHLLKVTTILTGKDKYSGVEIKTTKTMVRTTCLNENEITVSRTSKNVQVEEEGTVTVSAKQLYQLVNKLPDIAVQIKSRENEVLVQTDVKKGKKAYTIAKSNLELPERGNKKEKSIKFKIPGDVLKKEAKKVAFAADPKSHRPQFTGVFFDFADTTLIMVATDSHQMAMSTTDIEIKSAPGVEDAENGAKELSAIIPKMVIDKLSFLPNEEAEVVLKPSHVQFSAGDTLISGGLINAKYVPYQKIIPKEQKTSIQLDPDTMLEALDRATLFVSKDQASIKLSVSNNKLVLFAQNETGKGMEELDIKHEGDDINIHFSLEYLTNVFKNVEPVVKETDDEEDKNPVKYVTFIINGSGAPAMIKGDEKNVFIVVPKLVADTETKKEEKEESAA
jgi:DNA polymerase-3 subunit beta